MKRSCENTDDPEAQDPTYYNIDKWLIHLYDIFIIYFLWLRIKQFATCFCALRNAIFLLICVMSWF